MNTALIFDSRVLIHMCELYMLHKKGTVFTKNLKDFKKFVLIVLLIFFSSSGNKGSQYFVNSV